mmetsp:Transcript_2167/g.5414  ORF Transcript_2167/g.5414 Transcript_2167/m.5414 type:complete len:214 (+) Transcript_2167:285-926(+)
MQWQLQRWRQLNSRRWLHSRLPAPRNSAAFARHWRLPAGRLTSSAGSSRTWSVRHVCGSERTRAWPSRPVRPARRPSTFPSSWRHSRLLRLELLLGRPSFRQCGNAISCCSARPLSGVRPWSASASIASLGGSGRCSGELPRKVKHWRMQTWRMISAMHVTMEATLAFKSPAVASRAVRRIRLHLRRVPPRCRLHAPPHRRCQEKSGPLLCLR